MSSVTDSQTETSFQDIGKPLGVGYVSTEGEKLLKALRKIQIKLHQKQHKSYQKSDINSLDIKSVNEHKCSVCPSTEQHFQKNKCTETPICGHKSCDDNSNQLIESRLKLIESQLNNISMQLMVNNSNNHEINGQKRSEPTVPNTTRRPSPAKSLQLNDSFEDHMRCDDKYETSINAIKQLIQTKDKISKSKSLDAINHRSNPSKHFHLQYKDIPFLLGTNSSRSHSVIANRQISISKLKQHNHLCTDQLPTRKIFSQTVRTQVLDAEIKDLLSDLREEHNYICEEIQHLSQQLETITDDKRRVDFNRELYFLSRRILAKKRQINELQELHQIIGRNAMKNSETIESNPKPIVRQKIRSNDNNKCLNNKSIPKWI